MAFTLRFWSMSGMIPLPLRCKDEIPLS